MAVTGTRRGLLPRVFTLTLSGGIFSVALSVAPPLQAQPLPVRKHGGSCCPDFPLGISAQR